MNIKIDSLPTHDSLESFPIEAKLLFCEYLKYYVLSKIKSIKPRIHRITLSTNHKYEELKTIFDKFYIQNKKREQSYRSIAGGKLNNRDYSILYSPTIGGLPNSIIEFNFSNLFDLYSLFLKLGNVDVSRVEYALDFICKSPNDSRNLFFLFMKYIYFPYGKIVELYGSEKENYSYYIKNKSKSRTSSLKLYERIGTKSIPKRIINKSNLIDRVRLEITVPRKKLTDHNIKISKLSHFLEDPKFPKIMLNSFKFRIFNESCKDLPKEWSNKKNLSLKDSDRENFYSFQNEYINSTTRNIQQCISEPSLFKNLLDEIESSIDKFEEIWIEDYSCVLPN